MGYDYRGSGSSYVGSIDPASRAGLRPPGHDRRLRRAGLAVQAHPRRAVVRPGLVDGLGRGQREEPERHEVRLLEHGRRRHRDGLRQAVRPALGSARALGLGRVPEAELHRDLRLRHDVAPDLLRRRTRDEGALRPDQPRRPPRGGDLGARLRRRPDRDAPGDRREVPRRPHGAARRRPGAAADAAGGDVLGLVGRQRRERDRRLRRPGLGRRRAVARLGDRHDRDEPAVQRRGRPRRRVPRPGPRHPRQRLAVGRLEHVHEDAAAR